METPQMPHNKPPKGGAEMSEQEVEDVLRRIQNGEFRATGKRPGVGETNLPERFHSLFANHQPLFKNPFENFKIPAKYEALVCKFLTKFVSLHIKLNCLLV